MAGYDVFYEEKTALTREYFIEDLHKCVQFAAAHQVMKSTQPLPKSTFLNFPGVFFVTGRVSLRWIAAISSIWSSRSLATSFDHALRFPRSGYACNKTGIPLYTLMLSGHRRYPLGSLDQKTRQKALEMLKKAVILASLANSNRFSQEISRGNAFS